MSYYLMTSEVIGALILLAQRLNPGTNKWFIPSSIKDGWKCLICNQDLDFSFVGNDTYIIVHGMDHLKEKGLLVFI